jgi:hypothetical protein
VLPASWPNGPAQNPLFRSCAELHLSPLVSEPVHLVQLTGLSALPYGCPLGVLVRRTLDRDRRAGLQSRVEKLGHRLPDFLAQSRSVFTEVFDVPLIKKEPRAEDGGRE